VLTNSTFLPWSAIATPAAHASDVLPTPPFPVKKRMRVGLSKRLVVLSVAKVHLPLAALRVDHWQLHAGLRLARRLWFDTSQTRQFVPSRVAALADDLTIQQDQRQTLVSMLLQGRFDNVAGGKSLRLLGEVVAFDSDSLVCQPVKIRSEPGQCRIDTGSAHSGRTAHRGIENFNSRHEPSPLFGYRRLAM
jgi:hypothetical protein